MSTDNTVGSLTETQTSVIIGTLLGDGYMRCKDNAHLEINHSFQQRKYVDWQYRILENLVLTPPKKQLGKGARVAYRFATRSLPVLTEFYRKFYINGRKVVPKDLTITRLSLAVWFMDDGSRSRSATYFNTQQFKDEDQVRLIHLLRDQFGLKSNLNKDKEYWRIRLSTKSSKRLVELVKPLVLPIFYYKFPL